MFAMVEVVVREALDADIPAVVDLQNALLSTTTIEWTETPHTDVERADWLDRQRRAAQPRAGRATLRTNSSAGAPSATSETAPSGPATGSPSNTRSMSARTIGGRVSDGP